MLKKMFFFLSVIVIFFADSYGQSNYGLLPPTSKSQQKCVACTKMLSTKPREVQFGVLRDNDDNLFFVVNNKEWFEALTKAGINGLAVDVVSRDRYDCSKKLIKKRSGFKGHLLPPLNMKEIKQNSLPSENGELAVKVGVLPRIYRDKEVEYNIVFLKNKYVCFYNYFYNIKSYRWDLLDMGIYFDTLTYKSQLDKSMSDQEKYLLQHKTMRFVIPFKKNKAEFSEQDIKPLYDSLKLTDFDIRKITIRAYSSVEGNVDRNIELQQERAQNIVSALQAYQQPTIETKIEAAENWVDFLNDITGTSYNYLTKLTKAEIKEKLNDKKLAKELEPVLEKHRKAVVVLELSKKNKYKGLSADELVSLFEKSVSEKNLEQAIELQNSIFEKVRSHETPVGYLDKLEIPQKSEFSILLNKNYVFKYMMNETDVYNTLKQLNDLRDLIPQDGHIRYNICALKFKVWLLGASGITPADFKKGIMSLGKYGIEQSLIRRMLINYEIVQCEYYMQEHDYARIDHSLRYINSNYRYITNTDQDLLSLAQYFTSYARYDLAVKLLKNKVNQVDVDEDLLFYYLNLTLIDNKLINRPDYRAILLNAININPSRYCELFNSSSKGGITFQLLDNKFLRDTYCENCK